MDRTETENGYEVLTYQVLETDGSQFVTVIASDEFRYNVVLHSSLDDPEEDAHFAEYERVIDTLFIQ